MPEESRCRAKIGWSDSPGIGGTTHFLWIKAPIF
jgi:hypothetical protein